MTFSLDTSDLSLSLPLMEREVASMESSCQVRAGRGASCQARWGRRW